MEITNLPNELLSKIFSYLVREDRRKAAGVCKRWQEAIFRVFCIEVNQSAQMLDNSWLKRWSAIRLYDLSDCKENIVDLSFFFDQDYHFAPMSHRTSFYQNEVILTKQSSIYCCNYLNKKITELELPIEGTIENIHCYENSLVVLTSESVIIYDFTANRTEQRPSFFVMKDFQIPLQRGVVGFYDKKFLLLMCARSNYIIDVTKCKLVASVDPILDQQNLEKLKTLQNFFVNQEIIAFAQSTHLTVCGSNSSQRIVFPIDHHHQVHVHNFIDQSTLTYCAGTNNNENIQFCQANYNTQGSVLSRIEGKRRHIQKGAYQATAMWSSKQVCVVGLIELVFSEQINHGIVTRKKEPYNLYYLAFWDYHEVKLVSWPEEINCILALFGKIIINPGSPDFRFLDFTGTSSIDAKTVSLVSTPKKRESINFSFSPPIQISSFKATPFLPESPRRGLFNQNRWERIVGITLVCLVVIGYVASQAFRTLKNRR